VVQRTIQGKTALALSFGLARPAPHVVIFIKSLFVLVLIETGKQIIKGTEDKK
jgi:hypothetical protein